MHEGRALMITMVILAAVRAAQPAAATTLYVDKGNSSCSNTGSGSPSQPYCSIGAAAARATAGQTVLVAAGTYSENVTVANSGTSGAPIVFSAASGATVSGQAHGFTISSRSWITVQGFNVTGTTEDGFYVTSSSHITLSGNHVSYAGQPVSGKTARGIRLSAVSDSLVSGNTIDHNTDFGIYLVSGSTRVTVIGNRISYNAQGFQRAAAGIDAYGSPNNIFQSNVCHHNEDSGIEFRSSSTGNLVINNVTYSNGDHGIDVLDSTGMRIVSNSVYKNVTAGIDVEGASSGATIANNVSVDNGVNSPRTMGNIRVDANSTPGTRVDYDVVFLHQAGVMIVWGSTSYSSLAAFVSATGQEAHGRQADPRWKSPDAGDLHLTSGSPAIDAADSGVSGESLTDADGNPRADDPATPNTGAGPRAYDDRGAYELQPTPPGDAPPAAALAVRPASGPAPLAVTADASASTDTDATPIASYRFDFGDGTAVVGPQPGATATHTYSAAGTFVATVTVTDTAGLASSAGMQVTVGSGADAPPAAALSVTPTSGLAPLPVTADASGSTDTDATPIASYTFDFGDGTSLVGPQASATATHTYSITGTFVVTVTVTDTAGLASSAGVQVRVDFVRNPGFETNTSGWAGTGSNPGVVLTRVAGGHSGSSAAKLGNTGVSGGTCVLDDSPNWVTTSSAGTYRGSMWVRADVAGAKLRLRFREYNGGTVVGSAAKLVTLSTAWQQVTVSYTPTSPGASTLDFNALVPKAPTGTCFYADDASITLN